MNKGELVAFMAEFSGKTKAEAERALNLSIDSILAVIAQGNEVINLVGFGSFHIKSRKARKGRNPKTGEEINIPAYKQPVFRAGNKLKEACK